METQMNQLQNQMLINTYILEKVFNETTLNMNPEVAFKERYR